MKYIKVFVIIFIVNTVLLFLFYNKEKNCLPSNISLNEVFYGEDSLHFLFSQDYFHCENARVDFEIYKITEGRSIHYSIPFVNNKLSLNVKFEGELIGTNKFNDSIEEEKYRNSIVTSLERFKLDSIGINLKIVSEIYGKPFKELYYCRIIGGNIYD